MIGYNPSHLNTNETLLEAFHRVEAYLKANPQYQVYQSSAAYQEGTQEYALGTIVVPEGSIVGKGDVVLFSNVYYAVIIAVSETTFSVETATNFRGAQGVQGPKGDTGATGAKGETGLPALMYSKNLIYGNTQTFYTDLDGYNRPPQINDSCVYISSNTDLLISGTIQEIKSDTQQVIVKKVSSFSVRGPQGPSGPEGENGKDGNATLLYSGELSESITTAEIAQVTRPNNRGILVKDILISTAASTFGAMAQVTALPVGVTTVDVSFIGTLESGGGSGVSDYNNLDNIPVINQDLSASGFTPVTNTYYRHTGATTVTFTQGVIYLYDTAYHKLGESGGGTTLNSYEVTFKNITGNSTLASHLNRIMKNAKGRVQVTDINYNQYLVVWRSDNWMKFIVIEQFSQSIKFSTMYLSSATGDIDNNFYLDIQLTTVNHGTVQALSDTLYVRYFNDTEII